MTKDNINPDHYKTGGLETWDILRAKLTPEEIEGFAKGNVFKYLSREKSKNGFECLLKCHWYLTSLIEIRYNSLPQTEKDKYAEKLRKMQESKRS